MWTHCTILCNDDDLSFFYVYKIVIERKIKMKCKYPCMNNDKTKHSHTHAYLHKFGR